jgi:transposase
MARKPIPLPETTETPEPNKGGRPTKFTPETRDKVKQAIQMGATYEIAANYAGVSYMTFRDWMKRGEAGEDDYVEFFETIKASEGRAAVGWLAKIEAAANDGNWQAAAWKLERRYPHQYGKQVQEVSGIDGGPIKLRLVRETGFDPTPEIDEGSE